MLTGTVRRHREAPASQMAAWQCLLQAARLALPRRHRISAAGKNRRSREVCRRQKSQKPGGLPQAKIAEAERFAAGKNRRSREVCRRQKSQTSGGPGLTEMCASVPTRTSNPSRRPSKAYLRAHRYHRARLLWRNRSAMGSAMLGAYCREIFGARRVILRIIIYFSPLCNNYVIKNCLICKI